VAGKIVIQKGPLADLSKELHIFTEERDWHQFHTLKNLSMALAIEAAEVMELFQWSTTDQNQILDAIRKKELADELGDTFICLLRLADVADIDLLSAAKEKLVKNKIKYPKEQVKGSAKKYSEY
jgi:dCTP diphosphatase